MHKKGTVNKAALFGVLDLLDSLHMSYWIDGGWGVDILWGAQTREHRDVDIDFDARFTQGLLDTLKNAGYEITTDWRPCRIELHHPQRGYLDIHPLELSPDGSARQAMPDGTGGGIVSKRITSPAPGSRAEPSPAFPPRLNNCFTAATNCGRQTCTTSKP